MLVLAARARSSQIAMAAQLLTAGWLASIALWRWVDPEIRTVGFAGVDTMLAGAFFLMSRGRWFPVPLFFLHSACVIYSAYASLIGPEIFWVAAFLNRAFEIAVGYVAACSLFRIARFRVSERPRKVRETGSERASAAA